MKGVAKSDTAEGKIRSGGAEQKRFAKGKMRVKVSWSHPISPKFVEIHFHQNFTFSKLSFLG